MAALFLILMPVEAMEFSEGVDPQTGLRFWAIRDKGMSLRLVQRLPDQTRGFFLARGFNAAQVDQIARSCVFQTDFRNISSNAPLSYDLSTWVVHYQGKLRAVKHREDWAREWQHQKVPTAARTAFEWALYPTRQTYQPGDYNWGMSTFDLPPGARFDLEVVWKQFGETRRHLIRGLQCAADIHPEPFEGAPQS